MSILSYGLLKKEVNNSVNVGCDICMGGRSLDHISPEMIPLDQGVYRQGIISIGNG